MKTSLQRAPYHSAGDLMTYIDRHQKPEEIDWRDNKPFPAMLILDGITRGMSAARFVWHSDKAHRFEMFMVDAAELMRSAPNLYGGTVDTWWMIVKRGKNYGIRIADSDDLKTAGHIVGPRGDCPACEGVAYRYESWCPLPPTADQEHQYRSHPINVLRCLCGRPQRDQAHGYCDCSKAAKTACSSPNCQG